MPCQMCVQLHVRPKWDMTAIFWVLLHFPFPEIFACSSLEVHHRMAEKKSEVLGTESQVENLHAVSNMTMSFSRAWQMPMESMITDLLICSCNFFDLGFELYHTLLPSMISTWCLLQCKALNVPYWVLTRLSSWLLTAYQPVIVHLITGK